jgi:hypothetical protein
MARRLRRIGFGLFTVLGLARRGLFMPYRRAAALDQPHARGTYRPIEQFLKLHEPAFEQVLALIESYAPALEAIGREAPPAPRFEQDWFPRLDAAAAYAIVRAYKPPRIVEVGSGHSTRFMARAVRDGKFDCRLTAIDPAPRADLSGLAGVQLVRRTLQEAGLDRFAEIRAGDVVFIDSSHLLMPGSDVDMVINRVLPLLPAGVLVHLHDIFLPDEYPAAWSWRGYNEQLVVAPLLLGGSVEIGFASHYAATRLREALRRGVLGRLPLPDGAHESSLWLRTR